MADLDPVYRAAERQAPDGSVATRRQFVAGAAATLGGLGLLAAPGVAFATKGKSRKGHTNDPQTILNVAATAEVLATIVNTVGFEKGLGDDAVTQRNIAAAAREELNPLPGAGVAATSAARRSPRRSGCPTPSSPPDQPSEHARGWRPDLHQRLPDRRAGVRGRRQRRPRRHGGRVHGRRGRPPGACPAVAGQARQRPRVHAVRPEGGGARRPQLRPGGLLRHPRHGRPSSRGRASASARPAPRRGASSSSTGQPAHAGRPGHGTRRCRQSPGKFF